MSPKQPPEDYASLVSRLNDIVEVLEDGDTSVEDAMKAFEEGVRLTRKAQAVLESAEQRVQLLLEEDGAPVIQDAPADSE